MGSNFEDDLRRELKRMKPEERNKVLGFAKALGGGRAGRAGNDLARFAGAIPSGDLQQMATVIEDDCEKVDSGGW